MQTGEHIGHVVLLNDTSQHNHHGCRHVVATIRHCLAERGLTIIDTAPAGTAWSENQGLLRNMASADLILINGEGTLHHATELGARLLQVVDHPARGSKPVALINAIYQENPAHWAGWLGKMSFIAARDRDSQVAIRNLGFDAHYAPDLSLHLSVSAALRQEVGLCIGYGDSVFPEVKRALRRAYMREKRPRLYLPIHTGIRHPALPAGLPFRRKLHNARFKMRARIRTLRDGAYRISDDVSGFVGNLRQASIYLTGRYHGICLALASGVPFRAIASNSYKIEALLRESGLRPERLAPSVADIADTRPEEWQFTPDESMRLSTFLTEGRQRTHALFDRLAELARERT